MFLQIDSKFIFETDKDEIVKLLIKHGGDINKKGSGGMTALQRAAGWGKFDHPFSKHIENIQINLNLLE